MQLLYKVMHAFFRWTMPNFRKYLTAVYNLDATSQTMTRKYAVKEYRGRFSFPLPDYPNNKVQLFSSGHLVEVHGYLGHDEEILTQLKPDMVTRDGGAFTWGLDDFVPGRDWQNAMYYVFGLAKQEWNMTHLMLDMEHLRPDLHEKMLPTIVAMHSHVGEMLEKIGRLYLPSCYAHPDDNEKWAMRGPLAENH